MTHNGSIGRQAVPKDIRDIRGTTLRGADNNKLGEVSDVIIDHDTMDIRYLVVESQGWLDSGTFLLPANRVSRDENDENNLAAVATRGQIEQSPTYDNLLQKSGDEWDRYQTDFKRYWDEEPVMHIKGSDRIITMPDQPAAPHANSRFESREVEENEPNVSDLFPDRMTPVFSDTSPGSGKVTLRPKAAIRAEDAASGVTLLKPRWWESFENYLKINKDEIQAKCPECPSKAA
jgi:sporulation protein YlmC with PRC-barrel domain